ncbi:MAG: cyclic nucleotide-binding domain-containing protein [Nevskiaceae bacterium]|nr:MAG: cyclic nucleotide-binding domain-containing protein [Nevskiaceae bacterium]
MARHPFRVVGLCCILSLGALLVCFDPLALQPRLIIDPAVEHLLPAGDADRAVADRVRETFGDADAVIVAVHFDNIFTERSLQQVDEITQRLRGLDGASAVVSLATVPNLLAQGEDLEVSSFTEQAKRNPALIAEFPHQLAANPLYNGTLLSKDGKVTSFAIVMNDVSEQDFLKRDYGGQIRKIVRDVAGDNQVWITGTPVGRAATTTALIKTLKFTIPAVFAVILLLLLIAFRSLRAMLVAAATVGMALLWTMAAAVLLRIPMNLVTAIVPPLVITLGLSYSIYLISAYFTSLQQQDLNGKAERSIWLINRASVGLVLSAGTTVISFSALLLNVLPAIRHFSILASIGSAIGVALSLTFMPAALAIIGTTRKSKTLGEAKFSEWALKLATFDEKWRSLIIAIALILIPIDLIFAARIHAGAEFIKSFDEQALVRRDFEAINTAFNGANLITILIETHVNDALTDPERIRDIEGLEQWLRQQPEVGAVVSYVDHLKLINQSLNGNSAAYYSVPDDASSVKQLLVFGSNDQTRHVIDSRFRTALMTVRINVDGSVPTAALLARIEKQLKALPPPLDANISGSPVLATRTVQEIASGQFESIAIATFGIWLLLSLMFTSARAGFIALLPTVVPVAIYFGTLGLLDISLSPTTCLIACIVIGIAVDDTIQFLARFNADARERGSESTAVKSALASVLRPITLSTVALCLGFLVFTGSELKTQVQFGLLSAFTLFMAWFMNITLTPALGSKLRIVTLWDMLRLDLGQSPQHTIPLLSGLSLRQARVFALMSKLESVRADTRVIRQGDLARDIYVVVDGTLEAWVDSHGERKVLSSMGRGAVMGEAGYFGQRRTANVDTVTPARLLRFNSQDLERLRVRYPWIAATIFRNLNRIQAERIARMTSMLQ